MQLARIEKLKARTFFACCELSMSQHDHDRVIHCFGKNKNDLTSIEKKIHVETYTNALNRQNSDQIERFCQKNQFK